MRLFGSSSWALLSPQGTEKKLDVTLDDGGRSVLLKSPRTGKVVESLPLSEISWLPCAVAGRRDHCLALQLPEARRELVLRAPSRAKVDKMVQRLEAATGARAEAAAEREAPDTGVPRQQQEVRPGGPGGPEDGTQQQQQNKQPSGEDSGGDARSISFGSPVSQEGAGEEEPAPPEQAHDKAGSGEGLPDDDDDSGVCIPAARPASWEGGQAAAPGPAGRAAPWGGSPPGPQVQPAASPTCPVPSKSSVQRLEEAVARLELEVAASRPAGGSSRAAASAPASPATRGPASPLASPAERAPRRQLVLAPGAGPELGQQGQSPLALPAAGRAHPGPVDALVQENRLLLQQQAALEAEVCRVHGQLQAAAADNVRLAREAAAAVLQLRAAGAAAAAAARREDALRSELAGAAGRCEAAARELASLGPALERRSVQCEELRRAAEELSREKTLLTAALTATQLQLREATPAGFAAAAAEAAAAREELAAARSRVGELEAALEQARASGAEAAAAAEAAGARARAAEEEVRAARARLEGGPPAGDLARTAQERAEALAGANAELEQENAALASQVGELQRVGEELSRSCAALEASLQAAGREREGLHAALQAAQAAAAGTQAAWAAERAELQGRLGGGAAGAGGTAPLAAQADALRQELQEARRAGGAREQELQAELKLQAVKWEAEVRALRDRCESAAAAHAAEAARLDAAARSAAAAADAAARDVGGAQAAAAREREEARRARDAAEVTARDLQLEASTQRAEAARLAEEAAQAQAAAAAAAKAADEAGRRAEQAEAQLSTTAASHAALAQERKALQAALERASVVRDRAARERLAAVEVVKAQMGAKAPEAPIFYPTRSEVAEVQFERYVEEVLERDPRFAEAGIAKIVAPAGWTPRRQGYDAAELPDLDLPRPIRQHATGRAGLFRTVLIEHRSMPLSEFRRAAPVDSWAGEVPGQRGAARAMAETPVNAAPQGADVDTLERKFWKNVVLNPPLYGADVPGSLFDERCHGWSLRRLSSMLSRTMDAAGFVLPGVNQPYLYLGSWRSCFAWHTEDCDLHSVNYLHCGADKQWYVIPPAHRERFERLMRCLLGDLFCTCPEFMRHKELLVSPALLAVHNIPVVRVVHRPREFVVVYPGAYHSGFNHGFNIAESVNFATKLWLPIGAKAGYCECRPDRRAREWEGRGKEERKGERPGRARVGRARAMSMYLSSDSEKEGEERDGSSSEEEEEESSKVEEEEDSEEEEEEEDAEDDGRTPRPPARPLVGAAARSHAARVAREAGGAAGGGGEPAGGRPKRARRQPSVLRWAALAEDSDGEPVPRKRRRQRPPARPLVGAAARSHAARLAREAGGAAAAADAELDVDALESAGEASEGERAAAAAGLHSQAAEASAGAGKDGEAAEEAEEAEEEAGSYLGGSEVESEGYDSDDPDYLLPHGAVHHGGGRARRQAPHAHAGGRGARRSARKRARREAPAAGDDAPVGTALRSRSGRLISNFINHAAALLGGQRRRGSDADAR
eukprot:scaffold5.g860.t1